jgi:hypothetical protein
MGIYSAEPAPFVFSDKVQTGGISDNRAATYPPAAPPATGSGPANGDRTVENPLPPATGPFTGPSPEDASVKPTV